MQLVTKWDRLLRSTHYFRCLSLAWSISVPDSPLIHRDRVAALRAIRTQYSINQNGTFPRMRNDTVTFLGRRRYSRYFLIKSPRNDHFLWFSVSSARDGELVFMSSPSLLLITRRFRKCNGEQSWSMIVSTDMSCILQLLPGDIGWIVCHRSIYSLLTSDFEKDLASEKQAYIATSCAHSTCVGMIAFYDQKPNYYCWIGIKGRRMCKLFIKYT